MLGNGNMIVYIGSQSSFHTMQLFECSAAAVILSIHWFILALPGFKCLNPFYTLFSILEVWDGNDTFFLSSYH